MGYWERYKRLMNELEDIYWEEQEMENEAIKKRAEEAEKEVVEERRLRTEAEKKIEMMKNMFQSMIDSGAIQMSMLVPGSQFFPEEMLPFLSEFSSSVPPMYKRPPIPPLSNLVHDASYSNTTSSVSTSSPSSEASHASKTKSAEDIDGSPGPNQSQ